jgi:hypothetical protein
MAEKTTTTVPHARELRKSAHLVAPMGYDLARALVAYFGPHVDEMLDTDIALRNLAQAIVALVEDGAKPSADVVAIALTKSGATRRRR